MDPRWVGLVGGIGGGVLGLLGGVIGTYCSIRNTKNAAERRFMIRCSAMLWLAILIFVVFPAILVALRWIPVWTYWLVWIIFMLVAMTSIPPLNRRLLDLRETTESSGT